MHNLNNAPTVTAAQYPRRLTLSTGQELDFTDHKRLSLLGPDDTGGAFFLSDWQDNTAPAYYVPAHLYNDVITAMTKGKA